MPTLEPRGPGFTSAKQLLNRMRTTEATRISVEEEEVPAWQRNVVWNEEEMGLLALSMIRNFPIGLIILWKKPSGVRVPLDGRQRLTAIKQFADGEIAIPNLPMVPDEFKLKKYRLQDGDSEEGYTQLSLEDQETFDGYELKISQYDDLAEKVAMEVFVMLQGGKSLTKTEIRAALGGKLCDFVSSLTAHRTPTRHEFFVELSRTLKDRRKSHRNVCDILLHEYLYPGQDKHWTSLESMYREKSDQLSPVEKQGFATDLKRFLRAVTVSVAGSKRLMPQLRSAFFILDVFRAWRKLRDEYDLPARPSFADAIAAFESERATHPEDLPWIVYTNELSNAGYAKNRIDSRHQILMTFLLQRLDGAIPRERDRRTFTEGQKLAIWERANHQCEWTSSEGRCTEVFADFREADADHIILWSARGPTTVANGRLLCRHHNRGRR